MPITDKVVTYKKENKPMEILFIALLGLMTAVAVFMGVLYAVKSPKATKIDRIELVSDKIVTTENGAYIDLLSGKGAAIPYTIYPETTADKGLRAETSNPEVATATVADGVVNVSTQKKGEARINLYAADGKTVFALSVRVSEQLVSSVSFSNKTVINWNTMTNSGLLPIGAQTSLTTAALPKDATSAACDFEVTKVLESDKKTKEGDLLSPVTLTPDSAETSCTVTTAKFRGKVEITVTAKDGSGASDKITLEVVYLPRRVEIRDFDGTNQGVEPKTSLSIKSHPVKKTVIDLKNYLKVTSVVTADDGTNTAIPQDQIYGYNRKDGVYPFDDRALKYTVATTANYAVIDAAGILTINPQSVKPNVDLRITVSAKFSGSDLADISVPIEVTVPVLDIALTKPKITGVNSIDNPYILAQSEEITIAFNKKVFNGGTAVESTPTNQRFTAKVLRCKTNTNEDLDTLDEIVTVVKSNGSWLIRKPGSDEPHKPGKVEIGIWAEDVFGSVTDEAAAKGKDGYLSFWVEIKNVDPLSNISFAPGNAEDNQRTIYIPVVKANGMQTDLSNYLYPVPSNATINASPDAGAVNVKFEFVGTANGNMKTDGIIAPYSTNKCTVKASLITNPSNYVTFTIQPFDMAGTADAPWGDKKFSWNDAGGKPISDGDTLNYVWNSYEDPDMLALSAEINKGAVFGLAKDIASSAGDNVYSAFEFIVNDAAVDHVKINSKDSAKISMQSYISSFQVIARIKPPANRHEQSMQNYFYYSNELTGKKNYNGKVSAPISFTIQRAASSIKLLDSDGVQVDALSIVKRPSDNVPELLLNKYVLNYDAAARAAIKDSEKENPQIVLVDGADNIVYDAVNQTFTAKNNSSGSDKLTVFEYRIHRYSIGGAQDTVATLTVRIPTDPIYVTGIEARKDAETQKLVDGATVTLYLDSVSSKPAATTLRITPISAMNAVPDKLTVFIKTHEVVDGGYTYSDEFIGAVCSKTPDGITANITAVKEGISQLEFSTADYNLTNTTYIFHLTIVVERSLNSFDVGATQVNLTANDPANVSYKITPVINGGASVPKGLNVSYSLQTSSMSDIVSIVPDERNLTVRALANGKAVIIAIATSSTGDKIQAEITFTVTTKLVGMTIVESTQEAGASQEKPFILKAGLTGRDKLQLTHVFNPTSASDTGVAYEYGGDFISVTAGGLVTALRDGLTCITARSKADNSITATIWVLVRVPMTSVSLQGAKDDIYTIAKSTAQSTLRLIYNGGLSTPSVDDVKLDIQMLNASGTVVADSGAEDMFSYTSGSGILLTPSKETLQGYRIRITATSVDDALTCPVSIFYVIIENGINSISVGENTKAIEVGASYSIPLAFDPIDTTFRKYTITVNGAAVGNDGSTSGGIVSLTGLTVFALKNGTVTIIIRSEKWTEGDVDLERTILLTVYTPIDSIAATADKPNIIISDQNNLSPSAQVSVTAKAAAGQTVTDALKDYQYSSDNTAIVEVDAATGKLTAVNMGTAVITVTSKAVPGYPLASVIKSTTVSITVTVGALTVLLDDSSQAHLYLSPNAGQPTTLQLDASLNKIQSEGTVKDIVDKNNKALVPNVTGLKYVSSATGVAGVNASGLVTALGNGSAVITVKSTQNEAVLTTRTVDVTTNLTAVSVAEGAAVTIDGNDVSQRLNLVFAPASASDLSVNPVSDKTSVVEVNYDSVNRQVRLLPRGNGTANVTINASNGKTAVVAVTVSTGITSLVFDTSDIKDSMNVNETYTVKAADVRVNYIGDVQGVQPQTVSYTLVSTDPTVIAADNTAKTFTAKKDGTAKIYLSYTDKTGATVSTNQKSVTVKKRASSIAVTMPSIEADGHTVKLDGAVYSVKKSVTPTAVVTFDDASTSPSAFGVRLVSGAPEGVVTVIGTTVAAAKIGTTQIEVYSLDNPTVKKVFDIVVTRGVESFRVSSSATTLAPGETGLLTVDFGVNTPSNKAFTSKVKTGTQVDDAGNATETPIVSISGNLVAALANGAVTIRFESAEYDAENSDKNGFYTEITFLVETGIDGISALTTDVSLTDGKIIIADDTQKPVVTLQARATNALGGAVSARYAKIRYSSDDASIMTVDANTGVITIVGKGATSVRAVSTTNASYFSMLTIIADVKVMSITPAKSNIKIDLKNSPIADLAFLVNSGRLAATNPTCTYQVTGNNGYATVDHNSLRITALKSGVFTIKAVATDGSNVESDPVTVTIVHTPASFKIDQKNDGNSAFSPLVLTQGSVTSLTFTQGVGDAAVVTYTSSLPGIVSVNGAKITAVVSGDCVLSAIDQYGNTDTVYLRVIRPVTGINIGKASVGGAHDFLVGQVYELGKPVLEPIDTTQTGYTVNISNPNVVTYDKNTGRLTAIGVGSATVTFMTTEGGYTAVTTVTVEQPVITLTTGAAKYMIGSVAVITVGVDFGVGNIELSDFYLSIPAYQSISKIDATHYNVTFAKAGSYSLNLSATVTEGSFTTAQIMSNTLTFDVEAPVIGLSRATTGSIDLTKTANEDITVTVSNAVTGLGALRKEDFTVTGPGVVSITAKTGEKFTFGFVTVGQYNISVSAPVGSGVYDSSVLVITVSNSSITMSASYSDGSTDSAMNQNATATLTVDNSSRFTTVTYMVESGNELVTLTNNIAAKTATMVSLSSAGGPVKITALCTTSAGLAFTTSKTITIKAAVPPSGTGITSTGGGKLWKGDVTTLTHSNANYYSQINYYANGNNVAVSKINNKSVSVTALGASVDTIVTISIDFYRNGYYYASLDYQLTVLADKVITLTADKTTLTEGAVKFSQNATGMADGVTYTTIEGANLFTGTLPNITVKPTLKGGIIQVRVSANYNDGESGGAASSKTFSSNIVTINVQSTLPDLIVTDMSIFSGDKDIENITETHGFMVKHDSYILASSGVYASLSGKTVTIRPTPVGGTELVKVTVTVTDSHGGSVIVDRFVKITTEARMSLVAVKSDSMSVAAGGTLRLSLTDPENFVSAGTATYVVVSGKASIDGAILTVDPTAVGTISVKAVYTCVDGARFETAAITIAVTAAAVPVIDFTADKLVLSDGESAVLSVKAEGYTVESVMYYIVGGAQFGTLNVDTVTAVAGGGKGVIEVLAVIVIDGKTYTKTLSINVAALIAP